MTISYLRHAEIVELLFSQDMISEDQISEAQVTSKARDLSVLDSLILSQFVDEQEVQNLVCNTLGIAEEVLGAHEPVTAKSDNLCPLCNFRINVAYWVGLWTGEAPETGRNAYGSLYGSRCERCFSHLLAINPDLGAIQSIKSEKTAYKGNIRWKFEPFHG